MIGYIDWAGSLAISYEYEIYELDTTFPSFPANFVLAKETSPREWKAIFVGETPDTSKAFIDSATMQCAIRHGATHIHIHRTSNENRARAREKLYLINRWNPVCNRRGAC